MVVLGTYLSTAKSRFPTAVNTLDRTPRQPCLPKDTALVAATVELTRVNPINPTASAHMSLENTHKFIWRA